MTLIMAVKIPKLKNIKPIMFHFTFSSLLNCNFCTFCAIGRFLLLPSSIVGKKICFVSFMLQKFEGRSFQAEKYFSNSKIFFNHHKEIFSTPQISSCKFAKIKKFHLLKIFNFSKNLIFNLSFLCHLKRASRREKISRI